MSDGGAYGASRREACVVTRTAWWLLGALALLCAFAWTLDWDQWRRECEDVRGGVYRCFDGAQCECFAKGSVIR